MPPQYSPEIGARAVIEASKYVGLTEIKSNRSWDNLATPERDAIAKALRTELELSGWEEGWPYCAAFCEIAYRHAYESQSPELLAKVRKMLTPSCLQSYHNAAEVGWTSKEPKLGAIGIMKKGETANGHAFIVCGIDDTTLLTVEANTSPAPGSAAVDREGDGIYRKTRTLKFAPSTGLHLIGFILPMFE